MRFSDYLDLQGITAAEFAVRARLSKDYVYKLRVGIRRPSLDVIERIDEITKGAVTFRDWATRRLLDGGETTKKLRRNARRSSTECTNA